MKIATSAAAVALVISTAASSQPLEIKGFPLGGRLVDMQAQFPDLKCAGNTECTVSAASVMASRCRNTGDDNACRQQVIDRYKWGPTLGVWRVEADDGRVGLFEVAFGIAQFDAMAAALTEKYGPPGSVDRSPVQNRMGASFDNVVMGWTTADGTIRLHKRYDTMDQSLAVMTSTWFVEAKAAQRRDRAKASAKRL